MEFTSIVSVFDENLWSYHFPVPKPVAAYFIENTKEKRVICTLNGKEKIHAAIMSKGDLGHYLLLSKELRKTLGVEKGDEVHILMEKDESKYGMQLPEEMEEALASDPEGNEYFHQLTRGKQRSLIYQVAKFKSSNKRIQRALVILEHLRIHSGKLNFKQLNEEIKANNSHF